MILSGNLRKDWAMLNDLNKELEKLTEQKVVMEHIIKSLKVTIRNTLREKARHQEEAVKWHYSDYDSRWCKFVHNELPEEWYDDMTREEAIAEYIEDEWQHWYNPYNDGRDCTGVWFTSFIKVFPIPAEHKTIVYHWQSCDV